MATRGVVNGPLAIVVALVYIMLFVLAAMGLRQRQRGLQRKQRGKHVLTQLRGR